MKNKKLLVTLFSTALMVGSITGCGGDNNGTTTTPGGDDKPINVTFTFDISLASGKTALEVGDTDTVIVSTNNVDTDGRSYSFVSSKPSVVSVGATDGKITALAEGKAIIVCTEAKSQEKKNLVINVTSKFEKANGGFNFASSSGEEAIATRTEILGKLEKYAVESHLTGITLFENGGYVKYSSRLDIPTTDYITGYGFGILSEGNITDDLPGETNPDYKRYYHSAQTSNPGKINAMDDSGSQVSDLSGYITSAYWGTKMNSKKNGYEWYPILAKDEVNGKVNNRPIPVYEGEANPLNLYKKWRVYVKTGADGLKYRTNGAYKTEWDNKPVQLVDYEFPLKMLLTAANKLSRGAEIAGDKTYGIVGAQAFYNKTKETDIGISQSTIDETWDNMKASGELGIQTGTDSNGSYIQFELLNEIDDFTAMYTLSSNLYSPLPQEFVQTTLGGGEVKNGAKYYGQAKEVDGSANLTPNDTTLSLGAYYLEGWSDENIFFKNNDTWFEKAKYPERHRIEGVKITTYDSFKSNPDALYQAFYKDLLDSCGVPSTHIDKEKTSPDETEAHKPTRTLVTKGDSTFKLNVNSCTQDRWDYLFGNNGKICVTDASKKYNVKPWMSNDNFLNGLYWSINRREFAGIHGAQPSIDYLSNAYLSDPEKGVAYNSTDAHKEAVAKMHNIITDENGQKIDDYGFNTDTAISYFRKAYNELLAAGSIHNGDTIHISIDWMYQNDITEYGTYIKKYFEDAFNDVEVCNKKVTLVVDQPSPSSNWQDVYNEKMMKGQFDLAFGAISGNTYNPLNFLEVLKSDNSSGFTLNWGPDTSKVDEKNPLVYKDKKYSFDALWQVADHGGIVQDGEIVNSIKNCYLQNPTTLAGAQTNNLYEGFKVDIPMEFVETEGVALDVSKVALFVTNGETHNVTYEYDKANKVIHVTIPASEAAAIDAEIKTAQKMTDSTKPTYVEHPFTRSYYNKYWSFELTYTLSINNGTPVPNTVTIAMTKDSQEYK